MRLPLSVTALFLLGGCVTAQNQARSTLTDQGLYREVAQNSALNEYRCRGLSPEEANATMRERFKARIERVTSAMIETHGTESVELPELILMGRQCPAYRGKIALLAANLSELEDRLGLR